MQLKKIAFIGYGLRAEYMMRAFNITGAMLVPAAVADPDKNAMARPGLTKESKYYKSAEEMLENEAPDGVFIGTRCNLHQQYAELVMNKGLPLFLEKPVCIDFKQYARLLAYTKNKQRVLVSFPLRFSPIVRHMKELITRGALGEITMVQAVNNVPYGRVYYNSWYRDEGLTGGLFLQKATHDIDYISYLLGSLPETVGALEGKTHYKGNRPEGLLCPDCSEFRSCPESSYTVKAILKEEVSGEACCFAVDTGNHDCASLIMRAKNGAIIDYSQNFVAKKSAGRRGARFIGTKASAEFDFYSGEIRLDDYRLGRIETHSFTDAGAHFGGDEALALEFMRLLNGEETMAGLKDGLASAAVCLAAKESAESGKFIAVEYGF